MTYVAYEDLTPARVNYRIIPKLRKYYRADGTFDLFDINRRQMGCFRFLASKREFGFVMSRSNPIASFGTISIPGSWGWYSVANYSSLTILDFYEEDRTPYGAISGYDLVLKINNSTGYVPVFVSAYNYGDHGSSGYIDLYYTSGGSTRLRSVANGSTQSYSTTFSSPSTLWDYKDYSSIRLHGYAVDGSKYTATAMRARVYGIHKFNDEHPLYRYYR